MRLLTFLLLLMLLFMLLPTTNYTAASHIAKKSSADFPIANFASSASAVASKDFAYICYINCYL